MASRAHKQNVTEATAKSKLAIIAAMCAVLLVCLGILLVVARVAQGSGQSLLMSWSSLRHGFGRMFATEDPNKLWLAEFAALEPIDAHTHISQTTPEFVAMLQRLHMHVLDILVLNDRRPYRATLEPQRQDAFNFIASSTGRAKLCTTFDPFAFNSPNFSQNAIDGLNQDFQHGAIAVKVWKNVGMKIKNSSALHDVVLPWQEYSERPVSP